MKGKIILIEGPDASGKRMQSIRLAERLINEEVPCKRIAFPRYDTPTGRIVGQCYLGKERNDWRGESSWFGEADLLDPKIASLYYAADRRATVPEIKQIINTGTNLILDRYYPSNMAHQGGKIRDPKKRLELFHWLENLELELLELPREDLVIFLHMPANVANELKNNTGEKQDLHESNINHIKRAEEAYLQLSDYYGWKKIECAPDGTINSLRNAKDIQEEVYKHIRKSL